MRDKSLYHPVAARTQPTPPAQPAQPAQPMGALSKRRIFDAIRGAYDLGYNDARNARTVPGDSAPGYKGRDVEVDHGGALIWSLEAQPAPVVPATHKLVPIEPTEEMQIAGALAHQRSVCHDFIGPIGDAWDAMLQAAQKAE